MDYPTYASIIVGKTINVELSDSDKEYFEREGFSEEDVKNMVESQIRDAIFEYIKENDIKIILR